jgi:hypothetical protein
MASTPFDDLESAHEYLRLLAVQVHEVTSEIHEQIASTGTARKNRELDALRLVAYKLQQLHMHVSSARGVVNDLRMLRRVLTSDGVAVRRVSHDADSRAASEVAAHKG